MRTTIDLPDELHRIVSSLALHSRRSLSAMAVELIRRGLAEQREPARAQPEGFSAFDPKTALPSVRFARVVTPEDVQSLDDER